MTELLDVRDEQGNLTGEAMPRAEVHRTEAWHGVVLVWVYNSKGEILLQLRAAHLNAFPEKWDVTVSGHLAASEKAVQTAVRELSEEVGVYAPAEELEFVSELSDSFPLIYGKTHREHDYIFLTKQDIVAEKLKLQAAEVLDVRWITPDELERDLDDPVNKHHYSTRNRRVFQLIIDAMRERFPA